MTEGARASLFDRLAADGFEQVVLCQDGATGLRAVIAIHSTRLGPALGGTRFYPYPSEEAAIDDVLRLAKAMTYKAAAAGLDLGGGKAVIIGDPAALKSEALLRVYGRFVNAAAGRYITAEDVGTTQADMDLLRRETRWVTGVSRSLGGSGDPSEATAYGVLYAMKAVAHHLWGSTDLEGRHVVVAGVGKVGFALARHLVEQRVRVTVTDVAPATIDRARDALGVAIAPVEVAHTLDCDIYSPCALGGSLNTTTIRQLRCAAVVGAANNQLAAPASAALLVDAGVLYAPDYVVNAGGVINIAEELVGYHRERAYDRIRRIFDTTTTVLDAAARAGESPAVAADRLAEERISALGAGAGIRTFDGSA